MKVEEFKKCMKTSIEVSFELYEYIAAWVSEKYPKLDHEDKNTLIFSLLEISFKTLSGDQG